MGPGDRRLNGPSRDGEAPSPAFVVVGHVGRAHGVRGELRVDPSTDVPELRFAPGSDVYIGRRDSGAPRRATVVSSRPHQGVLLVRFDIAAQREEARLLTGSDVLVPVDDVHDPGPDAYYEHELVGLEVRTVSGERIGTVASLMETGPDAAAVLVVVAHDDAGSGRRREILVPMVTDFVAGIDLEEGTIAITPVPGLLDDGR